MGLRKFAKRLGKKIKKKAKAVGGMFKKPKMPGGGDEGGEAQPNPLRLVSRNIGVAKVRFYTDDPSL